MSDWIEIKTRPLTNEEIEYYTEHGVDDSLGFIYDCPLPDAGQEVIVTIANGFVTTDIFDSDGYNCYFENYCDDDEVIAWMPFPEPFKKPIKKGNDNEKGL